MLFPDKFRSLAISSNGRFVFAGLGHSRGGLWDCSKSPITNQTLEDCKDISSAAFSLDECLLVTGSRDGTARLWDIRKEAILVQVLKGHHAQIDSIAFSPDGCYVITGSQDCTARLWDIRKLPITSVTLNGHEGTISAVAFSPDGNFILTASHDKTARVWDIMQKRLSLIDLLLLLKLKTRADSLIDDQKGRTRLNIIACELLEHDLEEAQTILKEVEELEEPL